MTTAETLDWLQARLNEYGIPSTVVKGVWLSVMVDGREYALTPTGDRVSRDNGFSFHFDTREMTVAVMVEHYKAGACRLGEILG